MNVVSDYQFFFSLFVLIGWLSWFFLMTALFFTKRKAKSERKTIRIYSGAICLLSILLVFVLEKDTTVKSWTLSGSAENGSVLNFFLQIRDSRIKMPENYSSDMLQNLEEQYRTKENAENDRTPAIIVIMDESFTDFTVLGNHVQTEEPLLPYISSMGKNTICGYCYSSVYGGNTANSEFEFLTGNSMAFLPFGSVPYQQYLSEDQYSLLSFLHAEGYYCIATHPYFSNGWNRPAVYDYLGFDEMTFLSDYPQNNLIRKYVSDQEMFEYIIQQYEGRDQTKGFFLFGITIQNHGGYTYNDFESTVPLDYAKHYPEAEQFLSLANLSDRAVEYLIGYFSETTDPVVICFFGDHQPRVEIGFLESVHGGGFDDLDSEMLKYKVPFFIWANFEITEQQNVETSINYLSTYLLEACGFELPAYNRFLRDAEQCIPAITAYGYYSKSCGRFLPISEAAGEEKAMLNLYNILEYNNLFNKEQLSLIFQPRRDIN
jgi:phosphoglycerol transferase MdoB-like AlkP superfamily enzyme